jgi:hypothetical protein
MIQLDSDPINNGHFNDDDLICYCFRYTRKNIEEDFQENGYSKIMEKIKKEKTANGCNCREKNPKGR